MHFAGVPGLEPRLTEPESVVLPITPYPMANSCADCIYRTLLVEIRFNEYQREYERVNALCRVVRGFQKVVVKPCGRRSRDELDRTQI